jgi:hypothetical protein
MKIPLYVAIIMILISGAVLGFVGYAMGHLGGYTQAMTYYYTPELQEDYTIETKNETKPDALYGIVNIANDTIYYDVLVWDETIGIYLPLDERYEHLATWSGGYIQNVWHSYGIINNTVTNKSGYKWVHYGLDEFVKVKGLNLRGNTYGFKWVCVRCGW